MMQREICQQIESVMLSSIKESEMVKMGICTAQSEEKESWTEKK